jgi:RNA 2',3'-cyclic 3'-phosphodiesterase
MDAMDPTRPQRLFFALWPDAATRAALAALQRGLRGRATAPENLHLTMAFLGMQPSAVLPVLRELLAAMPQPELSLGLDSLGYFSRARIAWAGMRHAPPALREWHAELAHRLLAQGIGHDREYGFTPHVTLMRNAAPLDPGPIEAIAWPSPRLVLVRSVTRPEGPLYQVIAGSGTSTGAAGAA